MRLCRPILIFCALRWVGFPSSSGEADPPCGDLRGLLLIRDFIVRFQPLERCRFRRIESEFLDLFAEEILLFRMIVEAACLNLVSPAFDFLRRFFFRRFDLAIRTSPDRLRPVRFALEILSPHAFDKEARFFRNFMPMKTRIRSQRT